MFRRTLVVFFAFAVLALVLVVGYALTGLSGPSTTLADARDAIARGDTRKALTLLNLVDHALGPGGHVELRRQLLDLRARVHTAHHDWGRAVADLQELADRYAVGDQAVELELIRVLILDDKPELALQRANARLRSYPDDPRPLELAGEATQAQYSAEIVKLVAELSTAMPPPRFREAVASLQPYLYRAPSDPKSARGKARFEELLARYQLGAQVAQRFQPQLDRIRGLVQRAQDYYRHSLAAGGTPVSAYRGLAYALIQGGRDDDVVALAEVYLRRFSHLFTTDAAVDAARTQIENGDNAAAVESIDRFLTKENWRERVEQGRLGSEVRHLLLLKARALAALGNHRQDLVALVELGEQMQAAGLQLEPDLTLVRAYRLASANAGADLEALLTPFVWQPKVREKPTQGDDLVAEAMRLRVAAAEHDGRGGQELWVLKAWSELRPNDVEPLHLRTQLLLKLGQADEAFSEARTLYASPDAPDEALELLANAANLYYGPSGRDADNLLAQCLALGQTVPNQVAHDALFLALSQHALNRQRYSVAIACARRGAQLYAGTRWPRLLWGRAALAAGDAREALAALEPWHEQMPDDGEAVDLLRKARIAAHRPTDDLIYDLAQHGAPDADVAVALLHGAVARGDAESAVQLATRCVRTFPKDPAVLLAGAEAIAASGDLRAAEALLQPALAAGAGDAETTARVFRRALELEVQIGNNKLVPGLVQVFAERFDGDAAALREVAQRLLARGYVVEAHDLAQRLTGDPRHAQARSGADYLLAAQAALRLARTDAAEAHLLAALSFPDGRAAAPLLARLLLAGGRADEAREVPWDGPIANPADAALALALGRDALAGPWIAAALRSDPADINVEILAALVGIENNAIHPKIAELVAGVRAALLAAVVDAEQDGFAPNEAQATQLLRERFPDNPVARLLWARSLAVVNPVRALDEVSDLARDENFLAAQDTLIELLQRVDPKRLDDPELTVRMGRVVARYDRAAPARVRALVLRAVARRQAANIADPEEAAAQLAELWTHYADETKPGLAEIDTLVRFGRTREALELFDLLRQRLDDSQLVAFARVFGKRAQAMATAQSAEVTVELLKRTQQLFDSVGPVGSIVHFLIDHDPRLGGPLDSAHPRVDRVEWERQLLAKHLALVIAGKDRDVPSVAETLRRLRRLTSVEEALRRTEAVLHTDPSLLGLWVVRAQFLESQGAGDAACRSLRWLIPYADSDDVLLEYGRIAGQTALATADDDALLLRRLSARAAASPRAALARGLLALRQARYAEAAQLLGEAVTREDGATLFYRALALLPLPEPERATQAASLFAEFARRFKDSNVSEIADNLAAQLNREN